jgi:hypothetical protein
MSDLDIRPVLRPLHCVCSDDMLLKTFIAYILLLHT